ncbi:DNA polymerase IV [Lutibacter sp. B2]|nr:DNA polymerase IV [Lutibacter sp. B2]
MMNRIIFHIDVNSAFLSWEAVERLKNGESTDLRKIPSAIGGDPQKRHGIILAASTSAKKYGVKTGESLYHAFKKCPPLLIAKPNHKLYYEYSQAMIHFLTNYSPLLEVYSVDECFLDVTNTPGSNNPYALALEIKNAIYNKLGFTVNIGISDKKILAKMASDFEKPNKVHTLYTNEIKSKMWPLPIRNLFMVGKSTEDKLKRIGIYTIGDLANSNLLAVKNMLKKQGETIYRYSNGMDSSQVEPNNYEDIKGIGNSTTIAYDIDNKFEAYRILLSLTENVSMRLRIKKYKCRLICVEIKNSDFKKYTHQNKLLSQTDCTDTIYNIAKKLFDESWMGEPIRYLGIRLSDLTNDPMVQISMFDDTKEDKKNKLDHVLDGLKIHYGQDIITRASLLDYNK